MEGVVHGPKLEQCLFTPFGVNGESHCGFPSHNGGDGASTPTHALPQEENALLPWRRCRDKYFMWSALKTDLAKKIRAHSGVEIFSARIV
mmetsp:Transcript_1147/g.3174  ORF Transcript_1147/g.3174 Transcript_1147/m.3174 type:complete len:90 (+) Transcript_1147:1625-1894(+)